MIQTKLNELKDYIENWFKDEHHNIRVDIGVLYCWFKNVDYAKQFNREVKEKYSKYNLDFKIENNKVIVKYYR